MIDKRRTQDYEQAISLEMMIVEKENGTNRLWPYLPGASGNGSPMVVVLVQVQRAGSASGSWQLAVNLQQS